MLVNTNLALAIRCNECGNIHTTNLNLFKLKDNRYIKIKCDCGAVKAKIRTENYRTYYLKVHCFVCEEIHKFQYSLDQLLKGNIVIRCIDEEEICFIGNKNDIDKLLTRKEDDLTTILEQLSFYDYFTNSYIMTKMANRVEKLKKEGSILCECGAENIGMSLLPNRIEIKCLKCNGVQIIYAEDDKDYKNLLNKDYIMIHRDEVEYIDGFKFNSDR